MEEKLHRRWVKIGGKKGSIFDGNFHAALFSKLSADVEKTFDGKYSEESDIKQNAYVTGSVFASVSFLEAIINELFVDVYDKVPNIVNQLQPETISQMSEMWKLNVPKTASFKTLQKFQIALSLARKPLFDAGMPPYQDVECLIKLRNALIHYHYTKIGKNPER